MYRQKTIAKWLAIILLLTLIIACYVILNAVLNIHNSDNVADADNQQNVGGDLQEPPAAADPPAEPPVQLTYSEFPRTATDGKDAKINYMGGEGTDRLLDTIYYMGKRVVFFDSDSEQHDVRAAGVHIAVFDGATLERTVHVAEGERYIAASLLGTGLVVITNDGAHTRLRLYDDEIELSGSAQCDSYQNYGALLSGSELKLYASDGEYVFALTVSSALNVSRSNFTKRLPSARFDKLVSMNGFDLMIASNDDGMYMLTFSSNTGFTIKYELLNHTFKQFMPHSANNLSALYVLSSSDRGLTITGFDYAINVLSSGAAESAKDGVMIPDGNNITLLSDAGVFSFCAHLDPQYAPQLSYDSRFYALFPATSGLVFSAVRGSDDMFTVTDGTSLAIISVKDNMVTVIADTAAAAYSHLAVLAGGQLYLLLDADSAMGVTGFGNVDVFFIYLLTK